MRHKFGMSCGRLLESGASLCETSRAVPKMGIEAADSQQFIPTRLSFVFGEIGPQLTYPQHLLLRSKNLDL